MPEVSVIVPIYNAEKYLRRCVDSILKQTFEDFELILVNDGSNDSSADICDGYKEIDKRVIVIHKKNGGVSSARNAALKVALGKYIMFCDNDDFVEREWIQKLVDYIRKFPDSFINCEYTQVNMINGVKKHITIPMYKSITHVPIDEYYVFYKYSYSPYIWIRIFNSKVIKNNNLKFDENIKIGGGEDVLFCIEYMKYCKDFLYIPYNGYYRSEITYSLSRKYNEKYYDVIKLLYFPRKQVIAEKHLQEFYDEYFYRFYNCIDIVMDERNKMTKKQKINYINYILNDAAFKDTLNNASQNACDAKLKAILSLGNYRLLYLFNKVSGFLSK